MSAQYADAGRPAGAKYPPVELKLDTARTIEQLKSFLDLTIRETNLAVEYEMSPSTASSAEDAEVAVELRGGDQELLLEHNAELLLALEHIAHRWLRLDPRMHDRVRFDCGGYRTSRLDELKLSARVAAQRVRETGQRFEFNPMSSRERRIVHLELNGASGVRTISEGSGDHRHLVIYPAGKNDGSSRSR